MTIGNKDLMRDYVVERHPFLSSPQIGLLEGTPNRFASTGTGAPDDIDINSTGIKGLQLDATGDLITFEFFMGHNVDLEFPIGFALEWASNQTTASQTATFQIKFKSIAKDEAINLSSLSTLADNSPNTGDLAIAASTDSTTAYAVNISPFGKITKASHALERYDRLLVQAILSAVSGLDPSSDEVILRALFFQYMPKVVSADIVKNPEFITQI